MAEQAEQDFAEDRMGQSTLGLYDERALGLS